MKTLKPKAAMRLIALTLPLLALGCTISSRKPERHLVEIHNDAARPVVLEHKLDPEWSQCDVYELYHEIAPGEFKRVHGTGMTGFVYRSVEESGHWSKPTAPINLVTGRWRMTVYDTDNGLNVSLNQIQDSDPSTRP